MDIIICYAEPDEVEAIHRIPSGPRAIEGTLPLQPVEGGVRKRFFSETREGLYQLVAWVDEEVVGYLGPETFTAPCRRHAGYFGMAVRDGKTKASGWRCFQRLSAWRTFELPREDVLESPGS